MSKQSAISKYTAEEVYTVFCRIISLAVIRKLLEKEKRRFYQRLYPPLVTLWGFIFQRLNSDHSCDAFVGHLNSQAGQLAVAKPRSESSAAYCKARKRLPESVALGVLRHSASALHTELGETGLWEGYRVNLFDGSTLLLTQANAELLVHYGVASNQHGEAHWPLMRVVGGFDLYSGAIHDVAEGPYHTSEHTLAAKLIRNLGAGFVHVGDRNFGVYHMLQVIVWANSQALLRLKITQTRRLAGKALQPGCDLEVRWQPSKMDTCETDLPQPEVSGRLIYYRLEKAGFRPIDLYLFTTLLDREQFPSTKLVALYGERWNVELDLRHVKTNLEMDALVGKSVAMVRKELILGLLTYNLIRTLMGFAAQRCHRFPRELSFTRCYRRILSVMETFLATVSSEELERSLEELLYRLGKCLLPRKKRQRFEPRSVWRRPRVYPQIKGSREQARLIWLD